MLCSRHLGNGFAGYAGQMVAWQRAIQLLTARDLHSLNLPGPSGRMGYVVVPTHSPEDYRTLSGAWLRVSDAKDGVRCRSPRARS